MFDEYWVNPLTESEREVCQAALNHFSAGDFQTSADILANLVVNRPKDLRFKHNLAVAEYRQREGTGWGTFIEELNKAFKRVQLTPDPSKLEGNTEYPVLWFNLAVVLFHQKQHHHVFTILEKLVKNFSHEMTPVNCRARMLLIDLYVKMQQYERALAEIELFENLCRPGSSAEVVASSSQAKSLPGPDSRAAAADGFDVQVNFEQEFKVKLQQYKALCHLCIKSLKSGKKECKLLLASTGTSSPVAYVGTCLKAYLDYLRGNVKKSHKTITNIKLAYSDGDNYEKALIDHGDLLNVIWLNDEACCDFYLGKPNSSGMLLMKASQDLDKYSRKDAVKLPFHATKKGGIKHELLYNFGITLLNLKRPAEAFKYLKPCLKLYFKNPRLWLRVAECCIQIHKSDNTEHLSLREDRKDLVKEFRGTDTSQKIVFGEPGKAHQPPAKVVSVKDLEQPTLEYANICLENALRLVESDSIANEGCLYVPPSTPIFNIQEINCLHAAILCAAAYVLLTLENYPLAIKRCHQLMSLQNIPGAYQYLAKMYMGEAYFKYGKYDKAQEALFQENPCDVNFYVAHDAEEKKDEAAHEVTNWPGQSTSGTAGSVKPIVGWHPGDQATARAMLVYNQAVCAASAGDLPRAGEILRAFISTNDGKPLPPEFLKLAIYLHIRLGNVAKAKELLINSTLKP